MYFQPRMQQNILTDLQIIIIHYCTCTFLTWRFQNSLQILISTCTRGTTHTQMQFPNRFSQDTGLEGTRVGWDWKICDWIPEAGGVTERCSRDSLSLTELEGDARKPSSETFLGLPFPRPSSASHVGLIYDGIGCEFSAKMIFQWKNTSNWKIKFSEKHFDLSCKLSLVI